MQVNQTETAEIFGVSTRTVQRWVDNGLKFNKENNNVLFDVLTVHKYLLQQARDALLRDEQGDTERYYDLDLERAKLAESQRKRIDLDIASRQRELIEIEDISKVLKLTITNSKNKILGISSKAASRLNLSHDQARVIELLVREILNDLAKCVDEFDDNYE